MRKTLLGASATVNVEIPLNRYGWFAALQNQLIPNTRVEIEVDFESDGNLIWQAADDCQVVVTKFQFYGSINVRQ